MSDVSRRAIIVEDDASGTFLYRKTLEHGGFSVVAECSNSSEARSKLKNLSKGKYGQAAKPEIVICDKNLQTE